MELKQLVKGKRPEETTVVVAMSGGVDSSAAAALCHKQGYKTIGITLQLWDYTPASNGGANKQFGTCCALDDVYDARRVCQTIGIPHYVMNMETEFKDKVVDDFVETYLAGATPIPCVRCNQRIKFDALLEKAKQLGADVLVTGHYVRKGELEDGTQTIMRGHDLNKDQSYYLFTTTPEQLDFVDFPLGELTKDETRALAKELGLHLHEKGESQDICFVPGGDYREVVRKYAPEAIKSGNIVTEDGEIVGKHDGVLGYTVGQRKGLGGGYGIPMYVVEIRANANEVVIGPKESLGKIKFTVKELNWIAPEQDDEMEVMVKVRSLHSGALGNMKRLNDNRVEVTLYDPEEQVSPGQAAVFYDADTQTRMLGGGWIEVPEHARYKKPLKVQIQEIA